jgi:transcriptional regulator NrdR family protein
MNCPKCGNGLSSCIDSRQRDNNVYRRRKCLGCGYRYSTQEVSVEELKQLRAAEKALGELISHANEIKERMKK